MDVNKELNDIYEIVNEISTSKAIIVDDDDNFESMSCLPDWRRKLNPFLFYGFIHGSCHNFKNKKEQEKQIITQKSTFSKEVLGDKKGSEIPLATESSISKEQAELPEKDFGPYYIENFKFIITDVLNNSDAKELFSEDEKGILELFDKLSLKSQMLYVRLFQRKRNWIRVEKIKYSEIKEEEMCSCTEELCNKGFLFNEESCNRFDEITSLLSLQDVKTLVTDFKLTKSTSKLGKTDLIQLLKDSCKKQKTLFFSKDSSLINIVIKRAKKLLGHCIKVNNKLAQVFSRIITYFTMHFTLHDNHSDSILYTLLQVKLGHIVFPTYQIQRNVVIFNTKEEFTRYADAVELEKQLFTLMDAHEYSDAYEVFTQILTSLKKCLLDRKIIPEKSNLVKFSEQYVLVQLCRHSIILLEKEKKYSEALILVDTLLQFPYFKAKHRGMLWERKIIDLGHTKDTEKAFESMEKAINDPDVRSGFRLSMMQRLIKESKKKKIDPKCLIEVQQFAVIKEECLKAEIVLDTTSSNRAIFKSKDATGDSMSCVEQFVLSHYVQQGFPTGVHDEGGVVMTLFIILFWDIIFMNLPDAFRCPYQNCPLDFSSDEFYVKRKQAICTRLQEVYCATEEDLVNMLSKCWNLNFGKTCMGVNWDIFQSEQEAMDVAICLGGHVLGGICELYCKDLHCRRGGFPDLLVWNIETKSVKIIEVKGPGDKLSTKQIIWLEILNYLGVDAIVCHVTGVGAKRKRISS